MSWNPAMAPVCPDAGNIDSIETLIIPRSRDLGGFEVRRALPAPKRQMVGPFIFFDQVGPAEFLTNQGIDVRPHPHIGLSTVTYLYKGEFQHRDSLGTNQIIYPGEVNWMTAGKGVTHSERTSRDTRSHPHGLFGIQTWVALPESAEGVAPAFEHRGKDELPFLDADGKKVRLIVGNAYGEKSPVSTFTDMFYLDAILDPGAVIPLPEEHEDRGVYILQGSVTIAGQEFESGRMMVFRPRDKVAMKAGPKGARLMMLGGATLNGPRYIWWNFVASSLEKIEEAKESWRRGDWHNGQFHLPPGDEDEFAVAPEG
jgi:redox-sensitive bicupin YhaK (pirin superfamily)